MPFVAKNIVTGERVDISQIERPRTMLKAAEMVCPVCGHPMIIKSGAIKAAHFSHKPGREDCPYAEYANGERPEHRAAKLYVRDYLAELMDEYLEATPELEVYIQDVMHARNRIADVLFTFPNGWRVAHEIQLATITEEELDARTEDYLSAGIDVIWWFGLQAATKANLLWSRRTQGGIYEIDVSSEPDGEPIIYAKQRSSQADQHIHQVFDPNQVQVGHQQFVNGRHG